MGLIPEQHVKNGRVSVKFDCVADGMDDDPFAVARQSVDGPLGIEQGCAHATGYQFDRGAVERQADGGRLAKRDDKKTKYTKVSPAGPEQPV